MIDNWRVSLQIEIKHLHMCMYVCTIIICISSSNDIAILANTPNQAETLLHSLEWAAAHKTEYMCFNQTGDISTLDWSSLKLVDKFTYPGSSVSSTEKDIDTRLTKAWTAIDKLSIIWKSDLTNKMKRSFFQAAVMSILLYGCTTWTLTKRLEKKLGDNYTRMLRPARTYIQQLCEDTGCSPEDLPVAMNDRDKWRERVRDIHAGCTTWWWYVYIYIYIYIYIHKLFLKHWYYFVIWKI